MVNVDRSTNLVNINLNNVPASHCSIQGLMTFVNLTTSRGWTINDLGQCSSADPANDFVIEVDTTIVGSTSDTDFEINTNTSNGVVYNYNVDCDSENVGTNGAIGQTGNYICTYTNPGVYTISISDNNGDKTGFPRIYSLAHNDAKKITNLTQWGTGIWASMSLAFVGAEKMSVTVIDIPDLTQVWATNSMFNGASLASPDTSGWKTFQVRTMFDMFRGATSASPNTSGWNTANVTDMESMFSGATLANPNVQNWDITNINGSVFSNMDDMFFWSYYTNSQL